MENFENWDSMHFDILREIGNIGAGNAVTALSKLIDNKKVEMSVPAVNIVDFKDIANFVGGAERIVAGILVSISGDIDGIMMFLVKLDSARRLINILMGDMHIPESERGEVFSGSGFNEIEMSALEEIGNILTSSYLSSLAGLIDKKVKPSIPFLNIDMANAILSVPAIEFGKVSDKVLFIESVFGPTDDNVSGYFLLVPDMPSFQVILSSLGVM